MLKCATPGDSIVFISDFSMFKFFKKKKTLV